MASTGAGYIGIVSDNGLQTIGGKAAGVISGGYWVIAGSNTLAVNLSNSGGTPVFNTDMISLTQGGSGTSRPVGLALQDAASGSMVTVLQKGVVILPANGDVTAGGNVAATGGEGCVADAADANVNSVIGIALTSAASGTNNFALVRLDL